MAKKVFIDTSAWISYSLTNQPKHSTIKKLLRQFIKGGAMICTSNDVIDETVTRLVYSTNPLIVKKFIDFIKQAIATKSLNQLWVGEEIQTEAFNLVSKFSEHKLSLTDSTTIALMKYFGIEQVLSLDSDFKKVGVSTLP